MTNFTVKTSSGYLAKCKCTNFILNGARLTLVYDNSLENRLMLLSEAYYSQGTKDAISISTESFIFDFTVTGGYKPEINYNNLDKNIEITYTGYLSYVKPKRA